MRCQIRIPATLWNDTAAHLLASEHERMAYLLARASRWTDPWGEETTDLLVRRALLVPDDAMPVQSPTRVEVDAAFTAEVLRACFETGLSLVDVHTHPFSTGPVWFSGHDEANMRVTHAEFATEMPAEPIALAASLVLGQNGLAGAWTPFPGGRPERVDTVQLIGDTLEEAASCRN